MPKISAQTPSTDSSVRKNTKMTAKEKPPTASDWDGIKMKFVPETVAAKYLCLSTKTLQRLRCSGGGPQFCKLGNGRSGRIIYAIDDLNSWALDKRCASTSNYLTAGE